MADLSIDAISLDFYRASKKAFLQQAKNSDSKKPYYFIKKSVFIEAFSDEFQKTCVSLAKQYSLEPSAIRDVLLPRLNEQSETPIISTTSSLDASKIKDSIQSYVSKYSTEMLEEQMNQNLEQNKVTPSEETNSLVIEEQEKKEHFYQLFEEYGKLETFEEKRDFFNENFYHINNLVKEEQEQILDAYEKGNQVLELYDKIKKENPEASNEELAKLKLKALKNKAKEENVSLDYLEKCNKYNKLLQYIKLAQNAELKNKYIEQAEQLRIELKVSIKQQNEFINSENNINLTNKNMLKNEEEANIFNNDKILETDKMSVISGFENEEFIMSDMEEETLETDETFIMPGLENEELETSDEFAIPKVAEELENKLILNKSKIQDEKILKINTSVNLIMANVPKEDFQSDFAKDVERNPIINFFKNIQNRITQKKLTDGQTVQKSEEKPTLLNKLKNSINKLLNRKDKPLGIDTAENNTKSNFDLNTSFNDSINVSDEVKNNIIKTGQQTNLENKLVKTSIKIETNREEVYNPIEDRS